MKDLLIAFGIGITLVLGLSFLLIVAVIEIKPHLPTTKPDIFIDKETGCQYYQYEHTMTPRLTESGQPMCSCTN